MRIAREQVGDLIEQIADRRVPPALSRKSSRAKDRGGKLRRFVSAIIVVDPVRNPNFVSVPK